MRPKKRIMDFLKRIWHIFAVIAPLVPYIIPIFISAMVWIATYVFYPDSIAFEIVKDIILILIPSTMFVLVFHVYRKNMEKRMGSVHQLYGEIKNSLIGLEGKFQQFSSTIQQDKQNTSKTFEQINKNLSYYNTLFTTPCPKCSYPMSLPILSSMVQRSQIHERDGAPVGLHGAPEYETACPSCHTTWHIVYR